MKNRLFLFFTAILVFCGISAFGEVKFQQGKVVAYFNGDTLGIACYDSGNMVVFDPAFRKRFGGFQWMEGKKNCNGKRFADQAGRSGYSFESGATETISISENKKEFVVDLEKYPADSSLILSLITEFFGNSTLEIAGTEFTIAPYDENVKFFRILWNKPARKVTFCSENPQRSFSLIFPEPVSLKCEYGSGQYGITLIVRPPAEAAKWSFLIVPQEMESTDDPQ